MVKINVKYKWKNRDEHFKSRLRIKLYNKKLQEEALLPSMFGRILHNEIKKEYPLFPVCRVGSPGLETRSEGLPGTTMPGL
jgi:hypothetical protein